MDQITPKEVRILENAEDIQERREQVLDRHSNFETEDHNKRQKLDDSWIFQARELSEIYTKKVSEFVSWFLSGKMFLIDSVHCNSIEEVRALCEAHAQFKVSFSSAEADFEALAAVGKQIKNLNVGPNSTNPFPLVDIEAMEGNWRTLQKMVKERDVELAKEVQRQEENDKLRKEFAKHANAFHQWLAEMRTSMMEGSDSLELWLEATKRKTQEVRARRQDLKKIEGLGAILKEHLILDNPYTEHSTVGLTREWDQLDKSVMRMQHTLELQIQACNQSSVFVDLPKEFSIVFKHFDKDKSGRLNHQEFKSCLRAFGYDLPMVAERQPDPEFENILDVVDANRDGYVSLQEYMRFMMSKETENVQSSEEMEDAISAADQP